jgi:hypothetical protein
VPGQRGEEVLRPYEVGGLEQSMYGLQTGAVVTHVVVGDHHMPVPGKAQPRHDAVHLSVGVPEIGVRWHMTHEPGPTGGVAGEQGRRRSVDDGDVDVSP